LKKGGVDVPDEAAPGAATDAAGSPAATPAFLGTYQPRMDDKGRLFLPARFRDALAGGLVITRGQERCLYLFPTAEFAMIYARLRQAPVTSKAARDYQRVLLSGASDEVPDRQGRVTVPPPLREYAGLAKDCVVIGAGSRVEVWDANAWQAYLTEQEGAFADLSEEVLPGLI
jgi:MraZ protein